MRIRKNTNTWENSRIYFCPFSPCLPSCFYLRGWGHFQFQKTECACAFSGAIKLGGSVTRLGVETPSGPENDEAAHNCTQRSCSSSWLKSGQIAALDSTLYLSGNKSPLSGSDKSKLFTHNLSIHSTFTICKWNKHLWTLLRGQWVLPWPLVRNRNTLPHSTLPPLFSFSP